jgi:hypothetical protein
MNPSIILNRPGSGRLTLIPSLYRTWGGSMGIAASLGDDYTDTSMATGRLPRCKKGDGVLSLNDGAARVVIEMTDSARTGWTELLRRSRAQP